MKENTEIQKTKLLLYIRNILPLYSRIILFLDIKLQNSFSRMFNLPQREMHILAFFRKNNCIYGYQYISKKSMEYLAELYHMYEFSDRFQIVSYSGSYGTLFNYVHTGLLTLNEAIKAFLF